MEIVPRELSDITSMIVPRELIDIIALLAPFSMARTCKRLEALTHDRRMSHAARCSYKSFLKGNVTANIHDGGVVVKHGMCTERLGRRIMAVVYALGFPQHWKCNDTSRVTEGDFHSNRVTIRDMSSISVTKYYVGATITMTLTPGRFMGARCKIVQKRASCSTKKVLFIDATDLAWIDDNWATEISDTMLTPLTGHDVYSLYR